MEVGRVEEFRIGDQVACAGAGYASHAEHHVPRNLALLPDGLDFESTALQLEHRFEGSGW
jgi:NADPH:quinone reductase-like Zn-dependent oxidoreductase